MFKNGTNPLNLNFKLPTPLGATSSINSTNKKSSINQSPLNSGLKSNSPSANSSISTKTNTSATSYNSSSNNIAKNLTLRSPNKSVISNKPVTSTTTRNDRPQVKYFIRLN